MTLAIVSDIHGNLTALEAVVADIERLGVDGVVQGGDLALIGARPAETVDLVRELGWLGVVGNTDELLWRPELLEEQLERAPQLADLIRLLFEVYAPVTKRWLGKGRIDFLRRLPTQLRIGDVAVLHASPDNLWRGPSPTVTDEQLRETYSEMNAAIVAYGHIHRGFVRRLDGLTVTNSGSVGLPWDGDPRASYLAIGEQIELIRVEYDIEREVNALVDSDYPDGARIAAMLRTGSFVPVST